MSTATVKVRLRTPHSEQVGFLHSLAKRKMIRAGRRSGKTTGAAIKAVQEFLAGRRVLYATPTQEQVERFWFEVKSALQEPLDGGAFRKNETTHIIERDGLARPLGHSAKSKNSHGGQCIRGTVSGPFNRRPRAPGSCV